MPKDIADELRKAIRESGLSGLELARRAKVQQSAISRFLTGDDLRLSTAGKIARILGLTLKKSKGRDAK